MESIIIPTKGWKFNSQVVLIIYPTHINKYEYKKWIHNRVQGIKFIGIIYGSGEKTVRWDDPSQIIVRYDHSRVLIDFGKVLQINDKTFFQYNGLNPDIHLIKNTTVLGNVLEFMTHKDPELLLHVEIYNKELKENKYNGREIIHSWQVDLIEELKIEADRRKVI